MAENITNKITKRRIQRNYVTSTISITLVLFILGIIGLLFINSRVISKKVKENLQVSVFIKENARQADVTRLKKTLDASDYVKSATYISKEEAAKKFEKTLGEDFTNFLGENPLPSSIDIKLKSDFANNKSLEKIEKDISKFKPVKDVFYHKDLIFLINQNVKKISLVISIFAILLLIITIALINNTVRLLIYSKRFSINTMQLVGATDWFIKKPFIAQSAIHGSVSAILAFSLLFASVWSIEQQMEGLIYFKGLGYLFIGILLIGALISAISANFAVDRYLKIDTEQLYY